MRRLAWPLAALLLAGGARAELADAVGDTVGRVLPQYDLTAVSALELADRLRLTLRFTRPPPDLNAVRGLIELDTDGDPATGAISRIAFLCPGLTGLGVERSVDLFALDPNSGSAPLRDAADATVGSAAVALADGLLQVEVPRALLGRLEGNTAYAVVIGSPAGAGDCAGDAASRVMVADTTPDPFAFDPLAGVAPGTVVSSNGVTVTGINLPVAASLIGDVSARYSRNGSACTLSSGEVEEGDVVAVCLQAADARGGIRSATLDLGGVGARFDVTTAVALPGAPTGVSARPGDTSAIVDFAPPSDDGGTPILGYSVTANPGGRRMTVASAPALFTGLTNGLTYTFTVAAANSAGSGAAATSNPVTPLAGPGQEYAGPVIDDGGHAGGGDGTIGIGNGGADCRFEQVGFVPLTVAPPPGRRFPFGLVQFRAIGCTPGAALAVTVDLPGPLPQGSAYWKFGPTQSDPVPHWYTIPAEFTEGGRRVRFTIVDGGLGDDDFAAGPDGIFSDPGGPAAPVAAPVPLTGSAGLVLLIMLAVGNRLRFSRESGLKR